MPSLKEFLKKHATKSEKDKSKVTHTRIPSKENGIYGGSYIIEGDNEPEFYDLLYKEVITGSTMEYLTEKQQKNGIIYIDLDFRYAYEVEQRQHNFDFIEELVCIYLDNLKKIFKFDETEFKVFVMQKDGVNRLADKSLTKDGIHIIITTNCPHKVQMKLREFVMKEAAELIGKLPLLNGIDKVFDDGLSKGTTNVQLFGCRKPAHDAYKLRYVWDCKVDPSDGEFIMIQRENLPPVPSKELFLELCVRNKENRAKFELTRQAEEWANPSAIVQTAKKQQRDAATRAIFEAEGGAGVEALVKLYSGLNPNRVASGAYQKWYELAQATFNVLGAEGRIVFGSFTHEYGSINKKMEWEALYDRLTKGSGEKTLGLGSLHYWCREDNPDYYAEKFPRQEKMLVQTQIDKDAEEILEQLIATPTDVQFARYFVKLFGKRFVCTDIKNKIFHEFTDLCLWAKNEGGSPIRMLISSELSKRFNEKIFDLTAQLAATDADEDEELHKDLTKKLRMLTEIKQKLEKTCDKNNILREIQDFIYRVNFEDDMNKQKFILPIKGGRVIDLKTLQISPRTDKHKFNYECAAEYRVMTAEEEAFIRKYFLELFCGNEGTMQCVLDILKSSFTGETLRYIYFITGSGRNGKSLLFSLLSVILGRAMDVISKDVILKKKSNSNITTEFEKLDRVRVGYTTELKEEDRLAENIIKAITGGDGIDVRPLHQTNKTIQPTINLFAITNELPNFKVEQAISDRLIIIPFNAKFEVNKTYEKEMMTKLDLIFSFILKYGVIRDKFELTEEMKMAKEEYQNDNNVDHLADFLESKTKKVDYPADTEEVKQVISKNKTKCLEREDLIKEYRHWKTELGKFEPAQGNTGFSKRVAKFGFPSEKSGGKTYYKGLTWSDGVLDLDFDDDTSSATTLG